MTNVRTLLSGGSKIFTILVAAAIIFSWTAQAQADGNAANKLAVAGSETQAFAPNAEIRVLDETMKVSSVRDLILQLTSECSIVNALSTDTSGENQSSTGRVTMRIEIDGEEVPVSQDTADGNGSVVFCDRTYSRTVTDQDGDGEIDKEDDYLATRTANAFNWVAFDAGTAYDDPANGNNIINIEVFAKFESTSNPGACAIGSTCSEAFIGNRTLVVENTNAQNEEVATTTDPSPAPAPGGCGLPVCP